MTQEFEKKVLNAIYLDTRKYRYAAIVRHGVYGIWRLPIGYLDTLEAYANWELVKKLD